MTLFVSPRQTEPNLNGIIAAGWKYRFYEPGTSTPKTVYADSALTTPLGTSVESTADGRFPSIYFSGVVKVVLIDADGAEQWTQDNYSGLVQGAEDISYSSTETVKDALDSRVQTVGTLAELPTSGAIDEIRYVKAAGVVKWNGLKWVPDKNTVIPQMFGDITTAGASTRQAMLDAIKYGHLNRKRVLIPSHSYDVGTEGLVYSAASIDNLEIYFESGAEIVCSYTGVNYPFLLNLNGVGSNVKVVGNGAALRYSNAPASRGTNHAIYLFGDNATMVDLEVRGFRIYDPANFGLAIYAGPLGGVSTGNKNVTVRDIDVYRPKGDGVHVENFDSGVDIDDIHVVEPGDDSVAVSNFTGASGAPTKSTPTNDVKINNIRSSEAYSAVVRLLGVNRCTIDGITGTLGNVFGGIGAVAVSCDARGSLTDYGVDNNNITIDGVDTFGGAGLLYYQDGGKLTNLKAKGQCLGVNRYGLRLSQSGYAVGSKVSDVDVDATIEWATNPGVSGGYAAEVIDTRDVTLDIKVINGPQLLNATGNERLNIEKIKGKTCGGAGTTGLNIVNNTNLEFGRVELDASCTLDTGVTATNNTNVWHTALWDLAGATSKLSASGNTGVRGACQRVEASAFIGDVTGGTNQQISYSEAVFTGASHQLQATLISDDGLRWGVTGLSAGGFFALWTDTMTNVRLNYIAETNVGY